MLNLIKILFTLLLVTHVFLHSSVVKANDTFFEVQSIDTMKISRDVARSKSNDATFSIFIDQVTKKIAETGATHIALATPYDNEFIPFLTKWILAARKHNLNVWFRGNFSGWEEWFEYDRITRADHLRKTEEFILSNPQLFEDGDLFSSCPECENGGPGDPRSTGDTDGFRKFITEEYAITKSSFLKIKKNVQSNLFSMNGDVALLIMDKPTTAALDGVVVIDHYVKTQKKTIEDIDKLAELSGGKIILGEFGAPIPDIHGTMSENEQAEWIDDLFRLLIKNPNVIGVNYWTSHESSTELWHPDNRPKQVASIIKHYFSPHFIKAIVIDKFGTPLPDATIKAGEFHTKTNDKGEFTLLYIDKLEKPISVSKKGYSTQEITVQSNKEILQFITLELKNPSFFQKILAFFSAFF